MLVIVKVILTLFISFTFAEEKYQPDDEPPDTGYRSAVKYFTKKKPVKVNENSYEVDLSDAEDDMLLSLDTEFFLNNRPSDESLVNDGEWGLNLGLFWDETYFSHGVQVDYLTYGEDEKKISLLGGLIYPRIQTRFPLYIKGHLGLGYFTGDSFGRETLSIDYNLYTGVRFFSGSMLFNIEVGSKNYTKLLRSAYLNSFVLSSGMSIVF